MELNLTVSQLERPLAEEQVKSHALETRELQVRIVAGTIIAGIVAIIGCRSGHPLVYAVACLLMQATWAAFEHRRARQFARLRSIGHALSPKPEAPADLCGCLHCRVM